MREDVFHTGVLPSSAYGFGERDNAFHTGCTLCHREDGATGENENGSVVFRKEALRGCSTRCARSDGGKSAVPSGIRVKSTPTPHLEPPGLPRIMSKRGVVADKWGTDLLDG